MQRYTLLSNRYAKAILDLAHEKDQERHVYLIFKKINLIFKKHPELRKIFSDNFVSKTKKGEALQNILGELSHPLFENFLKLLVLKGRVGMIFYIAKSFLSLYNKRKNLKTAHLTTTYKVEQDIVEIVAENVKKQFGCEKVKVVQHIDKSIIAGYIIRVGDNQIDNTVSGKIKVLSDNIIQNKC